MTESHLIQQSTGIRRPMEIIGGALRNSSPARSLSADMKQNTILVREEPNDRLLY
jgi:hypothetical protein